MNKTKIGAKQVKFELVVQFHTSLDAAGLDGVDLEPVIT